MLCTLPLSRFSKATDNGQPGHICVDLGQLAKLDSAAVLQCCSAWLAWHWMHGRECMEWQSMRELSWHIWTMPTSIDFCFWGKNDLQGLHRASAVFRGWSSEPHLHWVQFLLKHCLELPTFLQRLGIFCRTPNRDVQTMLWLLRAAL